MSQPVIYQRIEAGFIFLACLYFYLHAHFNIIWFVILLFTIDIFMLGYFINNKVGAQMYNIGHSFIIPPILLVLGTVIHNNYLIAFSLIWLAHIGWDRAFGYGLKFSSGFKDTHLGRIGHNLS